eukprot:225157_1
MSTTERHILTNVLPNGCGHIVLNRPTKYNALSFAMLDYLLNCLLDWRDDDAVHFVLFTSNCDNAFCAGGDIEELAQSITHPIEQGFYPWQFIYTEYRLDLLIATYSKPILSFVNGYIMGGGCGISINSSYNIITRNAICSMPECSIHWFPDCLFSYYLHSKMPRSIGQYIGLTGALLDYKDMIYVNFANYFVTQSQMTHLQQQLLTQQMEDIHSFMKPYSIQNMKGKGQGQIENLRDIIDDCFGGTELKQMMHRLEYNAQHHKDIKTRQWAEKCHEKLLNTSPLSLKVTMQLVNQKKYNTSIAVHACTIFKIGVRMLNEANFDNGVKRWRAQRKNEAYDASFPYDLKHNHESCDLLDDDTLSVLLELDATYACELKYDEKAHTMSVDTVEVHDRPSDLKIEDIVQNKRTSKL